MIVILVFALASSAPTTDSAQKTATPTPTVPTYDPKKAGQNVSAPAPYGKPVVHNNVEITVRGVNRGWQGSTFLKPAVDKEWVVVSLTIQNLGNKDKTEVYNPIYFRITGRKGIIYSDLFTPNTENPLDAGEFFGGAEITGDIVQQVFHDDKALVLIYSKPFEGSRYLSLE